MHAPVITTERDLRLDLFRGIALWLIFLDHIPSNLVAWITAIAMIILTFVLVAQSMYQAFHPPAAT